jgi:hypothetical protein
VHALRIALIAIIASLAANTAAYFWLPKAPDWFFIPARFALAFVPREGGHSFFLSGRQILVAGLGNTIGWALAIAAVTVGARAVARTLRRSVRPN